MRFLYEVVLYTSFANRYGFSISIGNTSNYFYYAGNDFKQNSWAWQRFDWGGMIGSDDRVRNIRRHTPAPDWMRAQPRSMRTKSGHAIEDSGICRGDVRNRLTNQIVASHGVGRWVWRTMTWPRSFRPSTTLASTTTGPRQHCWKIELYL